MIVLEQELYSSLMVNLYLSRIVIILTATVTFILIDIVGDLGITFIPIYGGYLVDPIR